MNFDGLKQLRLGRRGRHTVVVACCATVLFCLPIGLFLVLAFGLLEVSPPEF